MRNIKGAFPFGKCPSFLETGVLDDIHSGSWYADTYDEFIKFPERQMLCPIILYIDKTGTDKNNRYGGIEPIIGPISWPSDRITVEENA